MSHIRLDRFRCERCGEQVDLEVGLEPEEWSRVTIRYPILEETKQPRLAQIGYDMILCDSCTASTLRFIQDKNLVARDTSKSVAFDLGDIHPDEIGSLVHATIERYRDQRDFEQALMDGSVVEADEGHTFRISHEVRGSDIVVGDAHHTDSDWFSDPRTFTVRAWSLKEALYKAAELPFPILMNADDEIVDEAIAHARRVGDEALRAAKAGEDDEEGPTEFLREALRVLSDVRQIPYGIVLDTANGLLRRLRAEFDASVGDLKPYEDCAACMDFEEGITVKRLHDHEGAGDEAPYDRRDGYVPLVHFGVGRADNLEAACRERVGIETVSSAPGKVTCRNCQDMIAVPPTMRRKNPWAPVVDRPEHEVRMGDVDEPPVAPPLPDLGENVRVHADAESMFADLAEHIAEHDEPPDEEPEPPEDDMIEQIEAGDPLEWYASLSQFVGQDFLLIDKYRLAVHNREVTTDSMTVLQATMDRIDWQGPRPLKPKPEGFVTHLTWRGLEGGALKALCGIWPQDVDRAIGAGFSKHFELVDCEDCRRAATVSYGAVIQHKGFFVHRADWSDGEQRMVCGTYEYAGHEGPCRPLTEAEQAEFDEIRAEDL